MILLAADCLCEAPQRDRAQYPRHAVSLQNNAPDHKDLSAQEVDVRFEDAELNTFTIQEVEFISAEPNRFALSLSAHKKQCIGHLRRLQPAVCSMSGPRDQHRARGA